jgi:hypothetical protein
MKGTIHKSIEKLVIEKFGEEKWYECLASVGLDEDHVFMLNEDVDEQLTMDLLGKMPAILGISFQQVCDAFGEYWVNAYVPKIYFGYIENYKTAKEFLLAMDEIHETVTKEIPNAKPPRFDFEDKGESIIVTYKSERGLIDLYISLVKGVGIYFKQMLDIKKLSETQVEITFC